MCQNIRRMLATPKQSKSLIDAFHSGTRLKFGKGEFIIRPGDSPRGVFYIESGFVKAFEITKYGEENLLIVRKSNEIFPLIWALTDDKRHVIYQALTPTQVWRLSRDKFQEYVRGSPDSLAPLMDLVLEMYRIHSERIINLEYRSVRERLISFLLTMAERFGKDADHGTLIDIPLRQQDVASSISASRETTARELSMLERRGLIVTDPRYIILRDLERLRAFLE